LKVSIPKSYYTPDENINVSCEIDNTQCKLKSIGIRFKLIQQIHMESTPILVTNTNFIKRTISEIFYSKTCVFLII
jgi:hypothetical protein